MFFKVRIADLNIGIEAHYETTERFCKDYLTDEKELEFTVAPTLEEIEAEGVGFSAQYLERLAVQRKISEQLYVYDRMLMHGAVIEFQNDAYMFTALSGTGKSTHIQLWQKYLGETVQPINGDKPFIKVADNEVRIYGTPWAGKEGWQRNVSVPLKGICFLGRGTENRIRRIKPEECLEKIMCQVYVPNSLEGAGKTLELLDKVVQQVPLYLLECDMSEEAVKTSFEAMTHLKYVGGKIDED